MMSAYKKQRGMTFITAVFTLLLFSILGAAFASLIRRQAVGSSQFVVDEQLLFSADSGMETAINWLYQDDPTRLRWWDNANPADKSELLPAYQNLSIGGALVNISSEYAATVLTYDIGAGDTSIEVNSTAGFPDTGILLINTEWVQYFARSHTEFLGCNRGYSTSDPNSHTSGTYVYPSCQLTANIGSTDTTIPVTSTEKFLPTGTVFIENEAIRYRSKDSANFFECERGSFDTTAVLHAQNSKAFPGAFELYITSTAQKDGRKKTVEALLQYQYGSKWD